jgi:glycosyltransferase involved in cell wall biosynthesis
MTSQSMVDAGSQRADDKPNTQAGSSRGSAPVLRVLHVINVEASNYFLNNLLDDTAREDVQFFFVTFGSGGPFVAELQRRSATAYALNTQSRSGYVSAMRELSKIIRENKIDIVHTHLFEPTLVSLLVAKRLGRKVIVTRHHSDAVYQLKSRVKQRIYLSLEGYINRHAHHIIAPSRMVRDILVEKEGVPPEKISLIPYGQTPERFDSITPEAVARVNAELGMSNGLALVCTSRLYDRKGHVYLFEALAPLIREGLATTLYLVGTGDYRAHLEQLTHRLGIQNHVRFLGWRDDALAIMAAADIIVHPSLEDALSSAVIESLMLARPIIATDISGVRDSLDDGKYGMIVPPADSAAFGSALSHVIANLDEARDRARRGREHILDYMDSKRVARAYTECYRTVAAEER